MSEQTAQMEESGTPIAEILWLGEHSYCRIEHLAEVSGLSIEDIEDLVETGVIAPTVLASTVDEAAPRSFTVSCIVTVKTARRLRDDFQLDRHGLALALRLMQRIEALEQELNALTARASVFPISRRSGR